MNILHAAHVGGNAGGFQAIRFKALSNLIDGLLFAAADDDPGAELSQTAKLLNRPAPTVSKRGELRTVGDALMHR